MIIHLLFMSYCSSFLCVITLKMLLNFDKTRAITTVKTITMSLKISRILQIFFRNYQSFDMSQSCNKNLGRLFETSRSSDKIIITKLATLTRIMWSCFGERNADRWRSCLCAFAVSLNFWTAEIYIGRIVPLVFQLGTMLLQGASLLIFSKCKAQDRHIEVILRKSSRRWKLHQRVMVRNTFIIYHIFKANVRNDPLPFSHKIESSFQNCATYSAQELWTYCTASSYNFVF